ncbi:amino acid racemase [Sphingomonas sp. ASV193]|uniref:aspartate/glutamate racemase family protein n=1 Tax=Sphingomonas sp. ASV193 TaxID=3144405 RepID=UPI0032E8D6A8
MRKLGLIGGTSWHSTVTYYELLNQAIAKRLGGLHSAPLAIESLDFAEVAVLMAAGRWDDVAALLVKAAERLKASGAEGLLIASNTLHRAVGAVAAATELPIVDIREASATRVASDGRKRIALLGTRATMVEDYARRPYESLGLEVQPLPADAVAEVDRIIFEELARGQVLRESQRKLKTLLTELGKQRVEAVVLGCTELAMIVDVRANVLPVYDTTAIHAAAAAEWMLGEAPSRSVAAAA